MTRYQAGDAYWRLPAENPPPGGVKLWLLTPGGVAVAGVWSEWFIAWSPLPKMSPAVKAALDERVGAAPPVKGVADC